MKMVMTTFGWPATGTVIQVHTTLKRRPKYTTQSDSPAAARALGGRSHSWRWAPPTVSCAWPPAVAARLSFVSSHSLQTEIQKQPGRWWLAFKLLGWSHPPVQTDWLTSRCLTTHAETVRYKQSGLWKVPDYTWWDRQVQAVWSVVWTACAAPLRFLCYTNVSHPLVVTCSLTTDHKAVGLGSARHLLSTSALVWEGPAPTQIAIFLGERW